ncbi:MAG: hypothetical protein F6K28_51655 [Microcoleus sp. SIO2G3]|nr:hypothetical protein [Microcoleus sp. SIO2G3]
MLAQKSLTIHKAEKPAGISDKDKCEKVTRQPETLMIAIANFKENVEKPSEDLLLEDEILDELNAIKPDNVDVCRTVVDEVLTEPQAQNLGKRLKVAVVIFGRRDSHEFDIRLKITNPDLTRRYILSTSDINKSSTILPKDNWSRMVAILTVVALSEIYSSYDIQKARTILEKALIHADYWKLGEGNKDNAKELAKAYFVLGQLFEKTANENCDTLDCEKARKAYQRAFELDNLFYAALLNKSAIQAKLGHRESAIEDYTKIIRSGSSLKVDALVNRANLYIKQSRRPEAEEDFKQLIALDEAIGHRERAYARLYWWNEPQGAIKDMQRVLQLAEDDPWDYHVLGLAQVQLKREIEAQQTYQKALKYLNEEAKADMLNELNNLARQRQDLVEVVNSIIPILKED